MPEDHDKSAPHDSDTNTPGGTPLHGEERSGLKDADVNFPSSTGSDQTSGHDSGDEITGQRPIARDDYSTGESTVGQPTEDSSDSTTR